MDVSSISSAGPLMQAVQGEQTLSASMIKMNANAQDQLAQMIQQNSQQAPQPANAAGNGFSTYA